MPTEASERLARLEEQVHYMRGEHADHRKQTAENHAKVLEAIEKLGDKFGTKIENHGKRLTRIEAIGSAVTSALAFLVEWRHRGGGS